MRHTKFIIWLLTSQCNLKCRHCYAAKFIGEEELDEGEKLDLVERAAQAKVNHLALTGGEIFVSQDALKVIKRAFKLGMSTSVVTNGLLLNEEILEKLSKYHTFIFLSLNGSKKETHESVRGPGTWEPALLAAEKMRRFRVLFSTIMAVDKLNFTEVEEYIALAKEIGALEACFIPVMPSGRANQEMILNPKEMVWVLEKANEAAERHRYPVSFWCTPFAKLVAKSRHVFGEGCRNSSEEIDLSPGGDVLLCDVLDERLLNVKGRNLKEVFEEQENLPLVQKLEEPELKEPCLSCPLRNKCRGGCYARSLLINGDIYAADPLCPRVAGVENF